jgi:D-alanine-D-alanine ligase
LSRESRLKVALLFGGRSAEHDVSLMSARFALDALTGAGHDVVLVGVGRDGRWHLCDGANHIPEAVPDDGRLVTLAPGQGGRLYALDAGEGRSVDVVFPVLHGPFGEDGTVQGLLEVADVPYVGAGVLGSAAAMDKDVAKRLLRDGGLPIPRFLACMQTNAPDFAAATEALGAPVFVKPARLGSSVGVTRAVDAASFAMALTLAFRYDDKILIEEAIPAREIEVAVLETADGLVASVPGEIVPAVDRHGFYSYDAKYLDQDGATLAVPADLAPETADRFRALAIEVFRVLGCAGLARIDFFLHRTSGAILVNEANSIPGFTAISMYPRLMAASGVPGPALAEHLLRQAMNAWQRKHARATTRV